MLEKKLLRELTAYCEANNLDLKRYINKLLKNAFTVDRYGERPFVGEAKTKPSKKTDKKTKADTPSPVSDNTPIADCGANKKVTVVISTNKTPETETNTDSNITGTVTKKRRKLS